MVVIARGRSRSLGLNIPCGPTKGVRCPSDRYQRRHRQGIAPRWQASQRPLCARSRHSCDIRHLPRARAVRLVVGRPGTRTHRGSEASPSYTGDARISLKGVAPAARAPDRSGRDGFLIPPRRRSAMWPRNIRGKLKGIGTRGKGLDREDG